MRRPSAGLGVALLCGALGILLWHGSVVCGEAQPTPEGPRRKVKVWGTVAVAKDKRGAIAALALTSVHGIKYNVALDEKGKKLGELAGKRAVVVGFALGQGAERKLTVESFKELKKEPKKEERKKQGTRRKSSSSRKRSKRSPRNR